MFGLKSFEVSLPVQVLQPTLHYETGPTRVSNIKGGH